MTAEQIVAFIKEWLSESNGQDYYDYCGEPHWWGDHNDLQRMAEALVKELP